MKSAFVNSFLARTEKDVFLLKRGKLVRLAIAISLMPLLFSCASINVMNMVPDTVDYGEQKPATISLEMERDGNRGTTLYSGTITHDEFKKAILKSLESAKLFKGLEPNSSADYLIKVRLIHAGSHPGFNMTAWVNAQWSLINQNTKAEVWTKLIKGKGHATAGEAFNGAKRQYMALERGAKANIDHALKELAKLDLRKTD